MKYHCDATTVKVATEVQQVDFQMRSAVALYGRAGADVGHAQLADSIQLDADPVNAVQRRPQTLELHVGGRGAQLTAELLAMQYPAGEDRKSTRLNSSHVRTSYAVFCLK